MKTAKIQVHKFGGTSMGDASCIANVSTILKSESEGLTVAVVSAMKGITNLLIDSCHLAQAQNDNYKAQLADIQSRHNVAIDSLTKSDGNSFLKQMLESDLKDINELLRGVWLSKSLPETTLEMVSGYGELWSSQILAEHLRQSGVSTHRLDARDFITIRKSETGPLVLWDASQKKLDELLAAMDTPDMYVVTGFVAVNEEGVKTTLGRNGSDFTASIVGKLFAADCVTIWTDVDGVYSADPRHVPEAQLVNQMSYQEAMELAYFGAKVLHPHTMGPAIESGVQLKIRNSFNVSCPGSLISKEKVATDRAVKAFASIDQVALVNVEGSGMIGVPGVAQRLFGALREVGVSVIMISQASSEHSICFAIPQSQRKLAEQSVRETFYNEIQHGRIQSIQIYSDCSILAAVGDNMAETPGVAGKFFASLGKSGINIRAIAQGSSERNISAVIDSAQATKALRSVHSAFYLSNFTMSVGLIGPGVIGKTFLEQIAQESTDLLKDLHIDFRIRGIANSKKMILDNKNLDLSQWDKNLSSSTTEMNIDSFEKHICADHIPHSVIVDCTASDDVAQKYPQWLEKGIHVVTPNKKASSADLVQYAKLQSAIVQSKGLYFHEATVGAGLPILSTLKDLVETGDEILKIEGVFSGTLSYIFNALNPNTLFSDIVKEAKDNGYTEPDPRDDLSGMDVARKVVILARCAGFNVDLSQLNIQSLIADELSGNLSVDEFMKKLPLMDAQIKELVHQADQKGSIIKYVGSIDKQGKSSVGIQSFPKDHAFARVSGTDNIIAFTTKRYLKQPLIVQGPGAGPAVTAAGVFSDLLRLASHLGARSS